MTAINAISISMEFAINKITRSPRFAPKPSRCFASPAVARPNSAYVMRCCSRITAGKVGCASTAASSMCTRLSCCGNEVSKGLGGRTCDGAVISSFDVLDGQPSEEDEHAGERDDRHRMILEALPDPRRARIEHDQYEGQCREDVRADECIDLLHFAEAREQANHRHDGEDDEKPTIGRRAHVDGVRIAAHAQPPALGE